jgi:hypothetical protein
MKKIKQEFNSLSGIKTMAMGPVEIIGGLACIGGGMAVAAGSGIFTGEAEMELIGGGAVLMGKGMMDLVWNGPKEMALSFF